MLMMTAVIVNAQNALTIHQKSGGKVTCLFSSKPVVTYSGESLILRSTTMDVEYPLSNLVKITFDDSANDIKNGVIYDRNEETVTGIYALDGTLVMTVDPDAGALPVQDLKNGIYLVKTKSTTYKIIKK